MDHTPFRSSVYTTTRSSKTWSVDSLLKRAIKQLLCYQEAGNCTWPLIAAVLRSNGHHKGIKAKTVREHCIRKGINIIKGFSPQNSKHFSLSSKAIAVASFWLNASVSEWVSEWVSERVSERASEWVSEWVSERVSERVSG